MHGRRFAARSSRLHPVRKGRIFHALPPRERRLRQPAFVVGAQQFLDPRDRRDPSAPAVAFALVQKEFGRGFFHHATLHGLGLFG